MHLSHTKTPLLICITATISNANAGIQWEQAGALFWFSIVQQFDFGGTGGLGATNSTISLNYVLPRGNTLLKGSNDSLIADNRYKSVTDFSIQSTLPTPSPMAGTGDWGRSAVFTIDEHTTFSLVHLIEGDFREQDDYELHIRDLVTQELAFQITQAPHSPLTTITLAPGTYRFQEDITLRGLGFDQPAIRAFSTTVALTVVPAPATLAALTPLGILATRRRR